MVKAIDIVKRSGRRPTETFRRDKLHSSVRAACLSVRSPEGEAELIAERVAEAVIAWLDNKPEVTSHDIRRVASRQLATYYPEAAYIYEQHRIII